MALRTMGPRYSSFFCAAADTAQLNDNQLLNAASDKADLSGEAVAALEAELQHRKLKVPKPQTWHWMANCSWFIGLPAVGTISL